MNTMDKEHVERCRNGAPDDYRFLVERYRKIEKPGRIVVMNGQSTIMFIRSIHEAVKIGPARDAFDTAWLHELADLEKTILTERHRALAQGWDLELRQETNAAGVAESVVTIEAKSGLAEGDYLRNKACASENWEEAEKFFSPLSNNLKQYLGGLKIVSLGEAFTSSKYPGKFVPYEIRLKAGATKQHNLALKRHPEADRWFVDGGI